tara:strand:- start:227 stop:715 length:489 start_codon:yes stop_codon:yes gene_type:complete
MRLENKKVYGHRLIDIWNRLPGYGMRKIDDEGNYIVFYNFGKKCRSGWQADHIIPKEKGGSNDLSNLQPLQWVANIQKSNKLNFLEKKIHNLFLELNPVLNGKRSRGIRFLAGLTYHVWQDSRVREPKIATIVSVKKKHIRVKWENKTISNVYPDPVLFEKL